MNVESARVQARNIYAKYSGCTRREAARLLQDVTDEDCMRLAELPPDEAKLAVAKTMVKFAERTVQAASKQLSEDAAQALLKAAETEVYGQVAEAVTDVNVKVEEILNGESVADGLDPDGGSEDSFGGAD